VHGKIRYGFEINQIQSVAHAGAEFHYMLGGLGECQEEWPWAILHAGGCPNYLRPLKVLRCVGAWKEQIGFKINLIRWFTRRSWDTAGFSNRTLILQVLRLVGVVWGSI